MRRINKLPDGEVKILARSRLVLAPGESGHSHVIEDDEAELIQIGKQILARFANPVPVRHEEHNAPNSLIPEPVLFAPGIWEIGRVREFDWFAMMARQVVD